VSLIQLRGVHRFYGAEHILGPLDLEIHKGDRIGLIGPNGSGKSTLLDILAGKQPDEGVVHVARGLRIGYLRQEVPASHDATLYEYALSAFSHLAAVEETMRSLEGRMADPRVQEDPKTLESIMAAYQRLVSEYEESGGYQKEARAKAALFGLGFSEAELDRSLMELSGGQRARAQLAHVLLGTPDLLILDEPTNHLDLEAVEWLQAFLAKYTKSLVLVSHDRELLRAVATRIWEIEGNQVIVYNAGYDASREQAAARIERMAQLYEADQAERARLEAFIRRYKAGSRATQAKSREKRLERMAEAPPPPKEAPKARFTVPLGHRSERRVCTLEGVSLGYGDRVVLSQVDLEIVRGERIGVAGPNGSGKSTLLKAIAGEIAPLAGRVDRGRGVVPAYYSQTRTDLDPSKTVLEAALDAKHQQTGEARAFLARFLFRGDDVFKPVGVLSGGEKSRLALARLLLRGGNFLILDEPTNHLDIGMREALEDALEEYEGTLLFVTHDRTLLSALADVIWWIEDGALYVIDGGYAGLVRWLSERRAQKEGAKNGKERPQPSKLDEKRRAAVRDKEVKAREKKLAEIEAEVERLAGRKAELEGLLADPATYKDAERAQELAREHAEVLQALEEHEALWLQIADGT